MTDKTLRSRDELEQVLHKIDKTLDLGAAHLELSSDARMAAMIDFIKDHVFPDEVLAKSLDFVMDTETGEFLKQLLNDHLSLLLVSDKTDEIIAFRGISIGKKDQKMDMSEIKNEKLQTSFVFLTHKNDEMDVCKRFGIDTCIEFNVLGTHREHRKRGIGTKIFQAALLFCKELGLDLICIKGEATSNYSQKIYDNNGFETLHFFPYDQYKVDGEVVFRNTGEHKSLKVYVKQLDLNK